MLDGACRSRIDRKKVGLCVDILRKKKELFLSAPDRERMISSMRQDMCHDALFTLETMGFVPESSEETSDEQVTDQD
jgi:hypothetical protein